MDWRTYPDMQQTYQSVSKHILTSKNTLWCGRYHRAHHYALWCWVCSLIPWCRLYGQNGLIQWCVLWCHDKLWDVNTWSVMPWCILWCQHDVCDAMMYSVMSVCGLWCHVVFCDVSMTSMMPWCILWCLWCHGIFCDVIMTSVVPWCILWCGLWCHDLFCDVSMWSVMPWCILWHQHDVCDVIMTSVMPWCILWCGLWCHDAFSDVRTCEMILWCQDMFFDAVFHSVTVATGRGLAGKPRQTDPGMGWHQNWQFLPVRPVTHWCLPPWAEVSTAFTFFEITAIFPHTTLPSLHPTIPSLFTMLLFPSICWTKKNEHGASSSRLLDLYANISANKKIFLFFFIQSRSDLVMVCVSVSYKKSDEENIKVNSEVKLLRSTIGTVPFLYMSVWW